MSIVKVRYINQPHVCASHLSRALLADDTMYMGDHTCPVLLIFFFWLYFFIPVLLRVNIRFIIFHIKLEYPWITINASHIEVSRCLALNELGMKKRSGNFEHWILATFELIKVTILWWIHYLLEVIHKNKNGQFSSNHKNPKCVLDF